MNRYRADGIVNSQIFQQVDSEDHNHSRDAAEQDRAGWADPVAGASDGHEPGEEAVGGVARIPLFGHEVAVNDGGESGRASGEGGVGGDAADADKVHGRKRAAWVEAVPAEPQDQSAGDGNGEVVRQHGSAAVALELAAQPRAQNDRAGQSDESADGVNNRGSGEIVEAAFPATETRCRRCPCWPASRPDPMPSVR